MHSMVKLLLLVSIVHFAGLAYGQTVEPANDQFISFDSADNTIYTCTVPASRSVVWEFRGSQIRSSTQFSTLAGLGVIIDPANTIAQSSNISISQAARELYDDITVQCFSDEVGGINSVGGVVYNVVTVSLPTVPGNLILVPSDPTLTLEWDRPESNSSIPIPLTYIVDINSTDPNVNMNFRNKTPNTFISVHFLEVLLSPAPGQCIMFSFSVSAMNIAGVGAAATIIDTVPISPDVTNINNALTAMVVDLQPLTVSVSFPPVTSCSGNFPLRNYTVTINGVDVRTFTPDESGVSMTDGLVVATIPSASLSGVALDSSFPVTITATNDVTSRTSDPSTLYTSDVQRAEVIFFENRLFLRCSFAGSSQARGCAVILTLTGSTETERFDLNIMSDGSASLCAEANNQREAYSSVEALDIEANGSDGAVRLDINSTVTVLMSEGEFVDMTGCRQPTDNTAAIVGGVIGGILGLLLIIAIIVVVVLGIIYGWWCAWLEPEDMDDIKKGLGAATTPLLAFAGIGSARTSVAGEREASPQQPPTSTLVQTDSGGRKSSRLSRKPKPFHQKLKDNKYLMVKTKRLRELIGDKDDAGHEKEPLMTTELKET